MNDFNIVILTGRLTADPELKQTQNGVSVTSFSIAVSKSYKTQEGEEADFINVVAWRSTAEFICKYFQKGKRIGIRGELQTRKWKDQNGNNRYVTEVIAEKAQFVESKKNEETVPAAPAAPATPYGNNVPQFEEMTDDDSLPF